MSPTALDKAEALTPPVDETFFSGNRPHAASALARPVRDPSETGVAVVLCGLFAVVAGYYRSRERLARLLGVAVFSAFAVSLFGIFQKFTWNGRLFWLREGNYVHPFGPFVNRNSYAAFAGTILPVALCLGLAALARAGDQGRRDALPKVLLWGFAAVTILGGVFLSLSRGGILSVCLSLLVVGGFAFLFGRRRSDLVVIGLLVLAGGLFLVWVDPSRCSSGSARCRREATCRRSSIGSAPGSMP